MANPQGHDPLATIFPCPKCSFVHASTVCPTAETTTLVRPVGEIPKDDPRRAFDSGTTAGFKMDLGKIRYELLPPGPLREVARVYTMGAAKYSDDNWRSGMSWRRVYGALQRHLNAFWGGENIDPESHLNHLAHAVFGCFALMEYIVTHPELDDRVREGESSPRNKVEVKK